MTSTPAPNNTQRHNRLSFIYVLNLSHFSAASQDRILFRFLQCCCVLVCLCPCESYSFVCKKEQISSPTVKELQVEIKNVLKRIQLKMFL